MAALLCSTILPTIGRPTLSQAVHSLLEQTVGQKWSEIIIVNDSGKPLPQAKWLESDRVRVIQTNRRERSVARNAGAAVARGKYLHFLDDDDWLLPGAFGYFWELANRSSAAWLYGGYQLLSREGDLLQACYPDERGNCAIRFGAGEWLPLQASWIRADAFFAVGGFDSLGSLLGGDEDVDLSRKISLHHEIAGTPRLVAAIRVGSGGSTTNYDDLRRQSRQSREKILNAPGAAGRLYASARGRPTDNSYWHGRLVWTYLTSIVWNLQHRRVFTATSRLLYGLASLIRAGRHVFSYRFWCGATRPHTAKGWLSTEI